jgi:endoglucanase
MNRICTWGTLGLCILALGFHEATSLSAIPGTPPADRPPAAARWGASLAGAEFGADRPGFSNQSPGAFGRDYTYNTERTVQYFCERGAKLLRAPIRWERIQPRLGEELDPLELARLRMLIGWARKHGGSVIIDLHNYGRYTSAEDGRPRSWIIDQEWQGRVAVSRQHFADLWRRIAKAFRDEPGVHGFGLMNEPHDMGASNWHEISQTAVDAIRATDDRRLVLVAGDNWSKAHQFGECNGPSAWVRDPAGNIAYEAHCYFDRDGSGRYELSYDRELAADPELEQRGEKRLARFTDWCDKNHVRGFIGEYAVPTNDARWLTMLARFQTDMRRAGFEGCYWAAGEWWGSYPLTIQPTLDFTKSSPALAILMK